MSAPLSTQVMGLRSWHGCLDHNRNHCPECRTCDCLAR